MNRDRTDRIISALQSTALAVAIGLIGALLLAHWAACESAMC